MRVERPAFPAEASDLLADLVLLYSHEWMTRAVRAPGEMVVDKHGSQSNSDPDGSVAPPIQELALIAAYEAALTVASEVRLEPVLQRIVDLARHVVPANY